MEEIGRVRTGFGELLPMLGKELAYCALEMDARILEGYFSGYGSPVPMRVAYFFRNFSLYLIKQRNIARPRVRDVVVSDTAALLLVRNFSRRSLPLLRKILQWQGLDLEMAFTPEEQALIERYIESTNEFPPLYFPPKGEGDASGPPSAVSAVRISPGDQTIYCPHCRTPISLIMDSKE